jgi:hypothetical protein
MKQNIPPSRFEEQEVDHFIGAFGIKPSAENRRDMLILLKEQKGQFMAIDRERTAREKTQRERGR